MKKVSLKDIQDYFTIVDDKGSLQNYTGNPDYALDDKWSSITLDDLKLNKDIIQQELLGLGRDLVDPVTGEAYSDDFYQNMLVRAVSQTEKKFDLAILPRLQVDRLDYHRNDFNAFAYMNTTLRPILSVKDLTLYYNNQTIMRVPDEWVKVNNRSGQIQVSPSVLMQGLNTTINPTIYPLLSNPYGMAPTPFQQVEVSPQMLGVTAVVGMMPASDRPGEFHDYQIQPDVQAYVAKLAAIEILEKWGRNIIGAGIASYSVSMDGISTDMNTTASAENTATTADIKLLQADMVDLANGIKAYYGNPEIGFYN